MLKAPALKLASNMAEVCESAACSYTRAIVSDFEPGQGAAGDSEYKLPTGYPGKGNIMNLDSRQLHVASLFALPFTKVL